MPVKPVLLVNEIGAGLGHVRRLVRVAKAFRNIGIPVVAAVSRQSTSAHLRPHVDMLLPAPVWPGMMGEKGHIDRSLQTGAISSYLAGLVAHGLADPSILGAMLASWSDVFALVKPSAVVADFAPAAMLAASGRIPAIAIGTGFSVPAANGHVFPRLHERLDDDTALQGKIIERVETARVAAAVDRSVTVVQALRGVAPSPACLVDLDPGRGVRTEPCLPPEVALPLKMPERHRTSGIVMAYLNDDAVAAMGLSEALKAVGGHRIAYLEGVSNDIRVELQASGVSIQSEPFTPSEIAATASVFLHHGGAGMTQTCALLGVPQVIAFTDTEKWLNAEAVWRRHSGIVAPMKVASGSANLAVARALQQLLADPAFAQGAAEWSLSAMAEATLPAAHDIIAAKTLSFLV